MYFHTNVGSYQMIFTNQKNFRLQFQMTDSTILSCEAIQTRRHLPSGRNKVTWINVCLCLELSRELQHTGKSERRKILFACNQQTAFSKIQLMENQGDHYKQGNTIRVVSASLERQGGKQKVQLHRGQHNEHERLPICWLWTLFSLAEPQAAEAATELPYVLTYDPNPFHQNHLWLWELWQLTLLSLFPGPCSYHQLFRPMGNPSP